MSVMFIRLGASAVIAFPFYIVARILFLRHKKVKTRVLRELLLCAFTLFMVGLIVLVLWPGSMGGQSANPFGQILERLRTGRGMNLIPLHTIRSYFVSNVDTRFVINIVANILMFSPTGFCLPLLWQRYRAWWKILCIGIIFSAGIETAQLFVGRSVDIDDVILNTAGVMLGYVFYVLISGAYRGQTGP